MSWSSKSRQSLGELLEARLEADPKFRELLDVPTKIREKLENQFAAWAGIAERLSEAIRPFQVRDHLLRIMVDPEHTRQETSRPE